MFKNYTNGNKSAELDIGIFKIKNTTPPKQGSLLISEPFSQDSFFKRSVVLLTEHNENGSLGFILNKPVKMPLTDIVNDFPDIKSTVSIGGPVNTDSIFFIHTLGNAIPNSIQVYDNIYWGGNFDILQLLIKSGAVKNHQVRFFIGYSGWRPQQLNNELERNFWIVSNKKPNNIMVENDEKVWRESLGLLGDKYRIWTNFPDNPMHN